MTHANSLRQFDLIIIGGGAAGFFAGVNYLERGPNKRVAILEASQKVLSKVLISGGGRCNVTHANFEPKPLTEAYPRGKKEILGPFMSFCTGDTFEWFEKRGVTFNIEEDGRVFPSTNKSSTIADVLEKSFRKLGGMVFLGQRVNEIHKDASQYLLKTSSDEFLAEKVLCTTGGTPAGYKLLEKFGLNLVPRVPSLFSFNIPNGNLQALSGLSVPDATVSLPNVKLKESGPLLITHWGFSGPAILKLSAFAAIELAQKGYKDQMWVNWLSWDLEEIERFLFSFSRDHAQKYLRHTPFEVISKRLWLYLIQRAGLTEDRQWQGIKKKELIKLASVLYRDAYAIAGKTTYKEEFVTAGGIDLKSINLKTMELKEHPNFYVAGEVMNVDAITGGYNFQHAWTSAWIAAQNI